MSFNPFAQVFRPTKIVNQNVRKNFVSSRTKFKKKYDRLQKSTSRAEDALRKTRIPGF